MKAIDGGQGVGIDREVFQEVERIFQRQYGAVPIDPGLLDQYNTELSNYNNKIMLAIIALRGALPSAYKLLKADL